jgi:sugar/nucleoside kinase (ribokinase family)
VTASNRPLVAGVTVLANLSIDLIDDAPPSPGGCASFAGVALDAGGWGGRIVAQVAERDRALFVPMLESCAVPVTTMPADRTSSFRLRYHGEDRTLTVEAVGPAWGPAEIDKADPGTSWVHVAPLLRDDFPSRTLAHLAARGHRVAYDGQGLVRAARLGQLVLDRAFDPSLVDHISVLKLAYEEAAVVAGGRFHLATAQRIGVPEILVTFGSEGCDLYFQESVVRIPAAWRVRGVHTTGAGDMFTVAYVAARGAGSAPLPAAEKASEVVAQQLQLRLDRGQAVTSALK